MRLTEATQPNSCRVHGQQSQAFDTALWIQRPQGWPQDAWAKRRWPLAGEEHRRSPSARGQESPGPCREIGLRRVAALRRPFARAAEAGVVGPEGATAASLQGEKREESKEELS